jgi:nuclear pore complex protein Nup188
LVPGIETRRSQIQAIFSNHETARTAISLFSWSEKLAIDGDPIYGELSVLFLLELSTIPEIAEQLAVDGLLGSLSSASLISYMRRRDLHPFSDSVGSQRCYSIWVRGFLPLLLNLLARLEASIAPEVALFLNQFPNLLQQAESSLDPHDQDQRMKSRGYKSKIALLQVTEVHSLALLTRVLENYRQAGHSNVMEVNWDSSNVAENVESWLDMQKVIGERIVPLGQREIDLAQIKGPSGTSRLEEKVVDELMAVKEVMGSDGDAE